MGVSYINNTVIHTVTELRCDALTLAISLIIMTLLIMKRRFHHILISKLMWRLLKVTKDVTQLFFICIQLALPPLERCDLLVQSLGLGVPATRPSLCVYMTYACMYI